MSESMGVLEGRIVINIAQAVRAYGEIRNAHLGVVQDVRQMGLSFSQAGRDMVLAGTAIVGGFGMAAKAAADFQKRLDYFAAVTNTSEADMLKLRDAAITWAEESIYSTSEVADGLVEMGKAGVSAQTLIDGLGVAIINLGQAADIGVTESSQIMISTMSQFAMEADKAVGVADRLSGTANASIIDMKDLGVTMKYAGGIAHAMGGNLDDLTSAIGILGNAGIRGSMAGTSLRQMMVSLTGATDPARKALTEIGVITKDGTNQFFDMNGAMKPLPQVFQTLQDSLKGYSKEQQVAYLRTIFNNRALTAASILTQAGADGFADMNTEIAKTTTAEVAAKRLDNLAGDIEILKGNVQTFLMQAGTPFQDFLRGIVQGLTGLLQAFTSLPPGFQTAFLWVTAIGGALLIATGAFAIFTGSIITAAGNAMRMRDALKGLRAGLSGGKGIKKGLADAVLGVEGLTDAIDDEIPKDKEKAKALDDVGKSGGGLKGALGKAKGAVVAMIAPLIAATGATWAFTTALLANPITWVVLAVVALIAALVALVVYWDEVKAAAISAWNTVVGWIDTAKTKLSEFFRDFSWDDLVSKAKAGLDAVISAIGGWVSTAGAKFGELLSFLGGVFRKIPGLLRDALFALPGLMGTIIGGLAGAIVAGAVLLFSGALQLAAAVMNGIATLLPKLAGWAGRAIGFLLGLTVRFIIAAVQWGVGIVQGIMQGLVTFAAMLAGWASSAFSAITGFFVSIVTWIANTWRTLPGKILAFLVTLPGRIRALFSMIAAGIMSVSMSAISWVAGNWRRIPSIIIGFLASLPGKVMSIIGRIPGIIAGLIGSAVGAAKRFGNGIINGFESVVGGLAGIATGALNNAIEAFKGMVRSAFNAAKEFAGGLWDGFKDGLGINSPSYIEKQMWQINEVAKQETKVLKRQVTSIQRVSRGLSTLSLSPNVDPTGYNEFISAMKASEAAASSFSMTASAPDMTYVRDTTPPDTRPTRMQFVEGMVQTEGGFDVYVQGMAEEVVDDSNRFDNLMSRTGAR